MSYYNPHPSNNYNVQNILENIKGSQVYSLHNSYAAPPLPPSQGLSNPYRSAINQDIPSRQTYSSPPINLYNSRSSQSFMPVSSMQDNRNTLRYNNGQMYQSSTYGIGNNNNYKTNSYENDNIYINPPPISNNINTKLNYSSYSSLNNIQSPNRYGKYDNKSSLILNDNPRSYPYSEEKKISQYVGSYVYDPKNNSSNIQPLSYSKQFETKKFTSSYQPTPSYGLGLYESTLQSRVIYNKDDQQLNSSSYTRTQYPPAAEPIDFRQSFGNPISQLNQSSISNTQQKGDLPGNTVKRDQNFYYDSYITINGLGTYKKYPLKIRKNMTSSQSQREQQDSNDNNKKLQISQNQLNNGQSQQQKSGMKEDQQQPIQKNQFMQILIDISKAEAEIESVKNLLINQPDYHIPSLFKFFDKNDSSRISMYEFTNGQKNIGLNLSQIQLSLIFTRILPNTSGLMTYENFEQLCLPLINNEVGNYVTSKRVIERNMSEKTIDLFRRLLHNIQESEQQIDTLRKRIFSSQTRVDQFYRELNSDRNGRITMSELDSGLQKYSENLSQFQIAVLFYRMCQNKSTYLTYDQFERFCYGGEVGRQQFWGEVSQSKIENSSYSQLKYTYPDNDQSFQKRNEFKKIIDKLIANTNLEVDIESIQNYLITKRDLKLHNLFSLFRPQKNFIDLYAFTETLKTHFQIPLVDLADITLLYRKIKNSNTQPELIDFSEFCNLIIPKDTTAPRYLFDQDKSGDLDFYSETSSFLCKLLKAHLNNEVIFNEVRLEIQTKQLNIQDLFDFFCQGKPYLEKQDFDKILKDNGSPHPTRYHNLIFSRFDPKQEGITNFIYFSNTLKI